MQNTRSFLSRLAAGAGIILSLAAPSAPADTFTATFTNAFGDGVWERDQDFDNLADPNDSVAPGNWNTGAYPHNGHAITDPNTGTAVPGSNPLYNAVINIAAPCTVTMTPFLQSLTVGDPATLTIAPNGILVLQGGGDLHDDGVIFVNNGGNNAVATLRFDANTNITGTGTIELRGFQTAFNIATFSISGGVTLTHGAEHFLHGYGSIIGFGGGTLVNNGTISADDPNHANLQLILNENTPNKNNGLIRAIIGGALLYSRGTIDQTGGGSFVADGDGSIIEIGGVGPKIIGGTVEAKNGGLNTALLNGGGLYLAGVTIKGPFLIPHAVNPVVVTGGLTNNGTITISDGASGSGFGTQLRFDDSSLLGGNGDVRLRGFGTTYGVANITISGGGVTLTNGPDHLIHGYGSVDGYFGTGTFINNGMISGDDPAGDLQLHLNPNTPNQNNNLIQAINGGALTLLAGAVNQGANGRFLADGPGSVVNLAAAGGQQVLVNGGTLATSNGGLIRSIGGILGGNVTNAGAFEIPAAGFMLSYAVSITNNGTITLQASDSFMRFDQNNTTIGGTGAIVLTNNAYLQLSGGQNVTNGTGHTIKGNGLIFTSGGTFTNNGIFSPGLSPGKITANGNYTQGSTGVLNIEIGGYTPVTEHDQLAITGSAALAGTLNLTLIDGFRPKVGDVFQILTYSSFTGAFSTINFSGFTAQVNYSPSGISFTVLTVPEIALNIATRLKVNPDPNQLIGGFIITGTQPKKVIVRAIGPSLSSFFTGVLADPTLELFQGSTLLASNNNWKTRSDGTSQQAEIEATTIPPSNDLESALVQTLAPGAYTAIVRGTSGGTGIAVVEGYDLDQNAKSKLANIATRGFVDTNENVMIGGFIVGGTGNSDMRVVVRAIGPSLSVFFTGVLQDPLLEVKNANGTTLISNDDWKQTQEAEITQIGLAPTDIRESAVVTTLPEGNYTAIVRGKGNTTGVALVEVYNVE